jgi:hypothetical protein
MLIAILGLAIWTISGGLALAVSGQSGSGRFSFTKGTDPYSFTGGQAAVPGRSCVISKQSSTSSLLITYHENISAPARTPSPNSYSSVHLLLNEVHVSGRQFFIANNTPGLPDTPLSMSVAFVGGAPGTYAVQVLAAGSQPLNFGGQDVNLGQPLDYSITIQEIP